MLVKVFGYTLATGAFATSAAMALLGGRFQRVEAAAYAGESRPWWFKAIGGALIGFYLSALASFLRGPKTWAGWGLMVIIPAGWAIKGAVIVFNPKGRQTVSAVSGDQSWRKIALARLPIAVVLAALARYA